MTPNLFLCKTTCLCARVHMAGLLALAKSLREGSCWWGFLAYALVSHGKEQGFCCLSYLNLAVFLPLSKALGVSPRPQLLWTLSPVAWLGGGRGQSVVNLWWHRHSPSPQNCHQNPSWPP